MKSIRGSTFLNVEDESLFPPSSIGRMKRAQRRRVSITSMNQPIEGIGVRTRTYSKRKFGKSRISRNSSRNIKSSNPSSRQIRYADKSHFLRRTAFISLNFLFEVLLEKRSPENLPDYTRPLTFDCKLVYFIEYHFKIFYIISSRCIKHKLRS